MSLAEEGAYRRLIDYCWLNETIPNDPTRCARLIGKGATTKIAKVCLEMFTQHPTDPSLMVHDRLEQEREKQRRNKEARRLAADIRWAKEHPNEQPDADATVVQTESKQDANALHPPCLSSSSSTAVEESPNGDGEKHRRKPVSEAEVALFKRRDGLIVYLKQKLGVEKLPDSRKQKHAALELVKAYPDDECRAELDRQWRESWRTKADWLSVHAGIQQSRARTNGAAKPFSIYDDSNFE